MQATLLFLGLNINRIKAIVNLFGKLKNSLKTPTTLKQIQYETIYDMP